VRNDSIITAAKTLPSFWGKSIGQIALNRFLAENHIDLATNPAIADYLEERQRHILALLSEAWASFSDTESTGFFDQMIERLGLVETVAILAQQFWDDRRKVATKLGGSAAIRCTRDTVRTIALFYHRFHNGGTENVIAYLIDLFSKMGYRVILFTNQEPNSDDYITAYPYDRVVLPAPTQGSAYRIRAKILLETLKDYQVDLFIYHAWIYELALWDALVIKSLGISFLMYTHNPWAIKTLHIPSAYRFEMPSIYALFDGVISLTRCDQLYWSCFNSNARFVSNPVLSEPPTLDERDHISDELVWVGRLSHEKQYEDLLEVMKLVIQKRPQTHLTIVGKGESEEIDRHFQETINAHGLSEAITMAGYHRDVSPYYRNAAAFLLTSLHEGFCYTLLESKAYALPCVSYDMPYLEMFREGRGIIAVPQGNKARMARAIIDLLEDPARLRRMGEEAKESFASYYERDMAAAWREIIAGSVKPTRDDCPCIDPDADETLRLLCETESFFTERALQRAYDERISHYETTIQEIHSQLEEVLRSKSFRVGNALMMIPRKIRTLLTRDLL
jgi:glycosyltransferase involved in cell wall biosynthesis